MLRRPCNFDLSACEQNVHIVLSVGVQRDTVSEAIILKAIENYLGSLDRPTLGLADVDCAALSRRPKIIISAGLNSLPKL
jgi:hypothetical protein